MLFGVFSGGLCGRPPVPFGHSRTIGETPRVARNAVGVHIRLIRTYTVMSALPRSARRDVRGCGLQVYISVTHEGLRGHADRVGRALEDVGDAVVFADVTSGHREEVERIRQADALVCLVGGVRDVRRDGTIAGEWELAVAVEQRLPIVAYGWSSPSDDVLEHGRSGYVRARLAHVWECLRRETEVRSYYDPVDLPSRVLEDLDGVRTRLRASAPEAFRSIHRRLRSHPSAIFDAIALSMHNMDTIFRVPELLLNGELSGTFVTRAPGGAGVNTMVALRRLGLRTAVVGAVGGDPVGVDLRTSLEDDGVDVGHLLTIGGAESGRCQLIRDEHQNYMNVVTAGANGLLAETLEQTGQVERVRDAVSMSKIVHFSSFDTVAEQRLQERLARELPADAVITFKPSTLHPRLGRYDVLCFAETELGLLLASEPGLTGAPLVDRIAALFERRARQGYVSPLIVAVYGGSKDIAPNHLVTVAWGAERYDDSVTGDRPVRLEQRGEWDTVGARDAAVAGVLYGLLHGRTPSDCANLGYVLATCAASEPDSRVGLPRSTVVRDRWQKLMGVHEPPDWLDPYG